MPTNSSCATRPWRETVRKLGRRVVLNDLGKVFELETFYSFKELSSVIREDQHKRSSVKAHIVKIAGYWRMCYLLKPGAKPLSKEHLG